MKVVGVLYGMEESFPPALIERINNAGVAGVRAEHLKVGAVRMDGDTRYTVIIDRISHDIPFYRSWLKTAALNGVDVINNPFWSSADDKFFNYALAARLGVAVPPTVLLPHRDHPPATTDRSMRNLEYPLDWDSVFRYVGFPAFLKPHDGGGGRNVHRVNSPQEFFTAYNRSRDLCMTLQRAVRYEEYFRCCVVDREKVRIMRYDPGRSSHLRYVADPTAQATGLRERLVRDSLTLCRALGYEINTVEFAVEAGIPYAIDFMNPAPDAAPESVGQENFEWIVNHVAEMAIGHALRAREAETMRWDSFLRHEDAANRVRP